jgi:uroporphyrinogen-III synthase
MILVTRNLDQSLALAKELESKGFKSIISPLFHVINKKFSIFHRIYFKCHKVQSIVISSANAISYLKKLKLNKNIPIFAIGKQTGSKLSILGYSNIQEADNSAQSLLKLVKNKNNKKELIIYLCGDIITQDMESALIKDDFNAKKIVSYKIKAVNHLSQDIVNKIKSNEISSTAIYSKNTATIFYKLLSKYNLLKYSKTIKLLCFSNEIAKYSKKIGFTKCENINKILN